MAPHLPPCAESVLTSLKLKVMKEEQAPATQFGSIRMREEDIVNFLLHDIQSEAQVGGHYIQFNGIYLFIHVMHSLVHSYLH